MDSEDATCRDESLKSGEEAVEYGTEYTRLWGGCVCVENKKSVKGSVCGRREGEGLKVERKERGRRNVSFPDLVLGKNQSRTVMLEGCNPG